MSTELLAVLAGLAAAVCWGSGDFGGGLASRKLDSLRVVILAQLIGTAALLAVALASGDLLPRGTDLALAAVAGLGGGVGLLALYQGLATGPMSIVAPLTAAVSGGLPVLIGILLEGWPSPLQLVGFVLALLGVWIISNPGGEAAWSARVLVLPLISGVGFTIFLTLIARLSAGGVYWPLVIARVASISFLGSVLAMRSRSGTVSPIPWALVAVAGLGDTAGNVLFAISTQLGRLDVAAVLGSLYPAATVILARLFLQETLAPRQTFGVVVALIAVVLIAI